MESKKVVLFIVECPSDQSALSVILSKVFDQDEVYVYVVHGDVTAENGATPQNIVRKVSAFIKGHMSTSRLRCGDRAGYGSEDRLQSRADHRSQPAANNRAE